MEHVAAVAPQVSVVDLMTIAGLVATLFGAAISAVAIIFTWQLYLAGSKVNTDTLRLLGDVKTSTHTTEVTSGRYTEPLVGIIAALAQQGVSANFATSRAHVLERLRSTLEKHAVEEKLREDIIAEASASFRGLEYQAYTTAARLSQRATPEGEASAAPTGDLVAPALPRVIRWLVENEQKFKFFGVKHLRETIFGSDGAAQEALQYAIDRKLVELYPLPNPKRPGSSTTALRLNRDHPLIQQILRESAG